MPCTLEMLRALELEDYPELARLAGAAVPEGWPPEGVREHQVPQQLRALETAMEDLPWLGRLILFEGTIAGVINLKGPPDARSRVEVGYEIAPQFRRKGIASEALRGVIGWCLKQPGVNAIQARTLPDNNLSAHMLKGIGFDRLGPQRDPAMGELIVWELMLRA